MDNKKFYTILGLLAIAAIISFTSYLPERFDIGEKVKVSNFPMQVGKWQGTDIPVSERDYKILETKNLIMREYKNETGKSVYLYIIYAEDNRKVSHPPEICLTGAGLNIVNKSQIRVTPHIKATQLVMESKPLQQLVLYWYKAGEKYTDNYLQQQLTIALKRTFGKRLPGAMIRVSTNMVKEEQINAFKRLKSFIDQIEPILPRYIP